VEGNPRFFSLGRRELFYAKESISQSQRQIFPQPPRAKGKHREQRMISMAALFRISHFLRWAHADPGVAKPQRPTTLRLLRFQG
jgi:hypothetical protein